MELQDVSSRRPFKIRNADEFGLSTVTIFPNPLSEFLTISFNFESDYSLLNLNGQTLKKGKLNIGENSINLSNISSGLYFLKLSTEEGTLTKKLIKQ